MKLTKEDHGKTVTVTKGDIITIILDTNPSTGYGWLDNGITAGEVESVGYDDSEVPPDFIGSPIKIIYKIKIDKPGKIKLCYCRPWAERTAALKSFEVNVQL